MITLHIDPKGSDSWNGYAPTPNSDLTDGPLATFEGARNRVAALRDQNAVFGPVRIEVHSGHYPLTRPLTFGPSDRDLHFVGTGLSRPMVDGSLRLRDWEEITWQGQRCWRTDLSAHLEQFPLPRSLFANGVRRFRPVWPKTGWLEIADVPDLGSHFGLFDGSSRFMVGEGHFNPAWSNQSDIEAVINHLWIEERMPVANYDPERRLLTSDRRSIFCLKNLDWMGNHPYSHYRFENVFESLSQPGEWAAHRADQALYYLPMEGESPRVTEIRIPILKQLVRVHGEINGPAAGSVHFEGIDFAGTDWEPGKGYGRWWDPEVPEDAWRARDSFKHFTSQLATTPRGKFAAVPQGAHDLPGAVSFENAAHCTLSECGFRSLGFHAIDIREACSHIAVTGCHFEENGAGGVKIEGSATHPARYTHHIRVSDCSLRQNGQIYRSACGIFVLYAQRCIIEHNELSHQPYTGISVGWCWHFNESPTREIQVLRNHVHHLGGELSDLGGIYTLGVQPGTLIEGNHLHHIASGHYGGWGLYLDEGSSFITVRGNLVHHTRSQCLHEHWGRQNQYTDNVFAHAQSGCIVFSREERENWLSYPPRGSSFLRNVLISENLPFFVDFTRFLETRLLQSDLNCYWPPEQAENMLWHLKPWDGIGGTHGHMGLQALQAVGMDLHSFSAKVTLSLEPHPALKDVDGKLAAHGILARDWSHCGPRLPEQRTPPCQPSFRPLGQTQGTVD